MILGFGLFASHTPYLILGILYIVYWGSYLISSFFPQIPQDLHTNQIHHQIILKENIILAKSSDYTQQKGSFSSNFSNLFAIIYQLPVHLLIHQQLFFLQKIPCYYNIQITSFSNRAPPFVL